jgi:hypothetical protein
VAGFEPTASSSRTKRATKLRHTPREASIAYRTRPSTGQTARLCVTGASVPDTRAFEFGQRLGGPAGSSPWALPLVAEIGVGIAAAAVGQQCDHRTAAAFGHHLGEHPEGAPEIGAGRRRLRTAI